MDANDFFVFNSATGALYFDADGDGAGEAQKIACFMSQESELMAEDIWVIA